MKTYHDLPNPPHGAQIRTDALADKIRQHIQQHNGRMRFSKFMEMALYHPQYGYYKSADFELGKQGDFTTAPEISPLFAKCLAKQCQEIMASLPKQTILELGAGSGRLALDLLTELEQLGCLPDEYYIYEISPALRAKQQHLIHEHRPDLLKRIIWLDDLPKTASGIIIANEVLDAMPVDCFAIENGSVRERVVRMEGNTFVWQTHTPSPTLTEKAEELLQHYDLADGYQSEVSIAATEYAGKLCDLLSEGLILFIDYGYGQSEYYHPQRAQGTLTCFYQHRRHNNPLVHPGLQDITAHVDFTRIIETAADHGSELAGFTTQAGFLLGNGLMDYAKDMSKGMSEKDSFHMNQAIKTLTMPTEMGDRVKVMAISKNFIAPELAGFKMLDRTRDL